MRFRSQTRTIALPKEPILLRIYRTCGDSAVPVEAAFHRLLDAADHSRTIGKSAGREWFLTHTRFLDEIARTLSLDIDVINEGEFDDNLATCLASASCSNISPVCSRTCSRRDRPCAVSPSPSAYLMTLA